MKKTSVAGIAGLLVAVYVALSAYVISTQNIEELLICADRGGLKIPFSKALCRGHLFFFRGSRDDIAFLHGGVGASFVVQGESGSGEREQVLQYLIGKGLDVNQIDRHQTTPLHSAVLANAAGEVEILLRNGARPDMKDTKYGLTPLQLALKLQQEGKTPTDRQEVIALLQSTAIGTPSGR